MRKVQPSSGCAWLLKAPWKVVVTPNYSLLSRHIHTSSPTFKGKRVPENLKRVRVKAPPKQVIPIAEEPLVDESPLQINDTSYTLPKSFAVVSISGRQYKVTSGDRIIVDKLTAQPSDLITLKKVLLVGTQEFTAIGKPLLTGASVSAEIEQVTKGQKILIFKKKRRKGYRRLKSVRPYVTILKIGDVKVSFNQGQLPVKPTSLPKPDAQDKIFNFGFNINVNTP
eukprot:TRINITY_DN10317_c0_g1_i1.p1 TRINITY_DN10317_c0_g1~~TRINITY_DN10317_c0_g1_i1.p1  ORF type:complete len:225 (-),score=36.70 TRINITY_DN10317_c0_g1_i1:41-715(-)